MKAVYPIPNHLLQGVKARKDLAREYGMSDSTFYRHLKKHGIQLPGGLLKPVDYVVIYQTMGPPALNAPALLPSQKM
jgi:hypothetical protein